MLIEFYERKSSRRGLSARISSISCLKMETCYPSTIIRSSGPGGSSAVAKMIRSSRERAGHLQSEIEIRRTSQGKSTKIGVANANRWPHVSSILFDRRRARLKEARLSPGLLHRLAMRLWKREVAPHSTRLLSFTFSASRYKLSPISLNFALIFAMPSSAVPLIDIPTEFGSFSVAA